MRFSTFRLAAAAALVPRLLPTPLSSQPPAAQAFANVTIGPAPASVGGKCNFMFTQPFLVLGTPGQTPTRVSDGVGQAHVTCSVTPSAGGTFQLQLSPASTAPMGGRMTIAGQADPKRGGQNLTATFAGSFNGNANRTSSPMPAPVT